MLHFIATNIYCKQSLKGILWNQIKSESIVYTSPLCLSSTLIEPVQIDTLEEPVQTDNKNTCLLWSKHECQHSAEKNIFNPFHGTFLFQYFLKYIRTRCFLRFSGGTEREQYLKIGLESSNLQLLILLLITEDNWR